MENESITQKDVICCGVLEKMQLVWWKLKMEQDACLAYKVIQMKICTG